MAATALIVLLAACNANEADDLFPVSPTERINVTTTELHDALTAQPLGWKLVYYTNQTKFGGFTVLMNFDKNGNVTMTSDVDSDTALTESTYRLPMGQTVMLSFDTKNHIHKLSDSFTPGLVGSGYEGEFDLLYYGKDGENLKFRTQKRVMDLLLVPATQSDWDDIAKHLVTKANLEKKSPDYVYRAIKVTEGSTSTYYEFNYNNIRRYATSGFSSTGTEENKSFGVAFTPNSILLNPAFEVNGQSFGELFWDETEEKFTATKEGVTAEIDYIDRPIRITDDYLMVGNPEGNSYFIYLANTLRNTQYTSEAWTSITTGLPIVGNVTRINWEFNDKYVQFITPSGWFALFFEYDAVNKKIVLTLDGANTNIPGYTVAQLYSQVFTDLVDVFLDPEGFYVEIVPDRFTYTNVVYVFTSAGYPNVQFPMYGA